MGPIDSEITELARRQISRAIASLARIVQVEIQDNGEFLLVRIEKDLLGLESETQQILNAATSILKELIRPRRDDYSWMVNVEHRGALLDSDVGGRS